MAILGVLCMRAIRFRRRQCRRLAFARTRHFLLSSLSVAILCACSMNDRVEEEWSQTEGSATELKNVMEEYWEYVVASTVSLRITLGLSIEALPDLSQAKLERDAEIATA